MLGKRLALLFTVFLLGVACQSNSARLEEKDECLYSFEEFSYREVDSGAGYFETTYPLPNWEYETGFAEGYETEFAQGAEYTTEIWDDNNRLWISRTKNFPGQSLNLAERDFIVFDPITSSQLIVSAHIANLENVWVDQIFLDGAGDIWGRNHWVPYGDFSLDMIPILSKYNNNTNQFELDFNNLEVLLVSDDGNFSDWAKILVDSEKAFWIVIPHDTIYKFEPELEKITKITDFEQYGGNRAVIGNDGSIYFRDDFTYEQKNREIITLNMDTGQIDYFDTFPEDWDYFSDMFIDDSNSLWMGGYGYRSPDGDWVKIFPETDPNYVRAAGQKGNPISSPTIIRQTQNGLLWFSQNRLNDKGLAWVDPSLGTGCAFTNGFSSNITEDSQGNLWVIIKNQLYFYTLER